MFSHNVAILVFKSPVTLTVPLLLKVTVEVPLPGPVILATLIFPDPESPKIKSIPVARERSPRVITPEPDPIVSELDIAVALPVPRVTSPVELMLPSKVLAPVPVTVRLASGTPVCPSAVTPKAPKDKLPDPKLSVKP